MGGTLGFGLFLASHQLEVSITRPVHIWRLRYEESASKLMWAVADWFPHSHRADCPASVWPSSAPRSF